MARIIAVCRSPKKGTKKKDVKEGVLKDDFGLVGDAHADCCTHRQVGKCIMPEEGVFARVIRGGPVRAGDRIEVG
jgi:MOSC domain-containing protein YiiM